MKRQAMALAALLITTSPAQAATFTWSFSFDGTSLTETSASAMAGTVLSIGDTVQITLQAAGSGFWSVEAGDSYLQPLNPFFAAPGSFAGGNTVTTFSLDGSTVQQDIKPDEYRCCAEFGVNQWDFAADLDFDTVVLDYDLFDAANQIPPLTGAFIFQTWEDMQYTMATVPLPASALLLGSALLAGGLATRRRRRVT